MKVTRWEEKLFNVLVDPIKESIDERKIESRLNYYYQRLDTQDLVVAGRIGDVESNYQLLADLGMMKGQWSTYRSLPESEMLLVQRYVLL